MKKYHTVIRWLYGLLFLGVTSVAMAESSAIRVVSAPEVKQLIEKENVFIVHALSRIEYEQQHIPSSINIPASEVETSNQLPKDKNTPIIFYCMGVKCPFSGKACKIAEKMGYREIYWFKGGIPAWNRFHYPMYINQEIRNIKVKKLRPKKVAELLKEESIFLLDVRPKWWDIIPGFIAGSVNISLTDLHVEYKILPKDRPIIINDALMKQSIAAAKYLIHRGYNIIGVVKGGIKRWKKEDLPVVNKYQK